MEVAYLALSVAGMLVAVSLSIRDEKRRDKEIAKCLAEITLADDNNCPGGNKHI